MLWESHSYVIREDAWLSAELPRGQSVTGRTEGLHLVLRLRWPLLPPPLPFHQPDCVVGCCGRCIRHESHVRPRGGLWQQWDRAGEQDWPGGSQPLPWGAASPCHGQATRPGGWVLWMAPENHRGPLNPPSLLNVNKGETSPWKLPDLGP